MFIFDVGLYRIRKSFLKQLGFEFLKVSCVAVSIYFPIFDDICAP